MSNPFYTASGEPGTSSFGSSAAMRSEFLLIEEAFNLLPNLSPGEANCAIVVNAGGTALTNTAGTLALNGNLAVASGKTETFNSTLTFGGVDGKTLTVNNSLTLAGVDGKTLTVNNNLTFAGTDGSTVNFGSGGTVLYSGASFSLVGDVTGTTGATVVSAIQGVTVSGVTGTGSAVLSSGPSLTAPALGVASATSINKVAITAPATSATLTIANAKTLTVSNSLTLAGTDGTTMTFPATSATLARTDAANTFTGHQTIEGVTTTGATGTGNLVFSASPTFSGTITHPDSATWSASGISSLSKIGVGMSPTNIVDVTQNQNAASAIGFTNTNSGTVAQAMVQFTNASGYANIGLLGTGYTASGVLTANTLYLGSRLGNTAFWTAASVLFAVNNSSAEVARVNSDGSFLVGSTTGAGAGAIAATGNITAFYSDMRLKTHLGPITDAVAKVCALEGFYYEANDRAVELGYARTRQVGLSAQQVKEVLPEVVDRAPISDKAGEELMTLHYDRIVALLVEAIKEQDLRIGALEAIVVP